MLTMGEWCNPVSKMQVLKRERLTTNDAEKITHGTNYVIGRNDNRDSLRQLTGNLPEKNADLFVKYFFLYNMIIN